MACVSDTIPGVTLLVSVLIVAGVIVYLASLLPAAIVTFLKGRYLIFAAGFLTFGLAWFPAALGLAPPESWWAKHVYDERQRARAENPERYPRTGWPVRPYLIAIGGSILAIALFMLLPTPLVGVDGRALGYSVSVLSDDACQHGPHDAWICPYFPAGGSGNVSYRVTVNRLGCWTGTRLGHGPVEGDAPREISGCISILDHARLFDKALGVDRAD
jgi:hypothetical protein